MKKIVSIVLCVTTIIILCSNASAAWHSESERELSNKYDYQHISLKYIDHGEYTLDQALFSLITN